MRRPFLFSSFGDRLNNFFEALFFGTLAPMSLVLGLEHFCPYSLERICPRKGCPCPWPRIFFVSLALASSLESSTSPLPVETCYFQQGGAPAHYSRKVGDYFNQLFSSRWIECRGPLKWAARSPDFAPYYSFLWGFLKSKIYSLWPQNLEDLEQKIRVSCGLVTQNLLQSVGKECVKRWLNCLEIGDFLVEV